MTRRLLAAALLALLGPLAACTSGGGAVERHEEPAVPVTVATAERKDAPVTLRAIGTVEAYSTVALKAQVEGQLAHVYFAEGQEVKRDDLLVQVDPRPFEAMLRQAEANVARDRVQAENARIEAGRLERLVKEGIVSREEYDQARTRAGAAEATVAADQAAVERTRIDLEHCAIRSPLDGRIGQLLVHEGNVVKANETTVAVINQLRPIHVAFAVPQQELPAIRRYMAGGPLAVEAVVPGGAGTPATGRLAFVNNTVDQVTGTVLLKGVFDNPDEELWPGQFVDVALRLTTEHDVVVVPTSAVLTGQQGKYVFVVKPDGTVESRPVVTGPTADREIVVQEGIAPGEQVVTEGQIRLAPGARVEVKGAAA